jgi:hypothetical protein
MKNIFLALAFIISIISTAHSQSVVPIRGDTIKVYKSGGTASLVVDNKIINRNMPASDTTVGVVGITAAGLHVRTTKSSLNQTLQQVFNKEVGGARLTKSDTTILPYNTTYYFQGRSIGTVGLYDDSSTANGSVSWHVRPTASGFLGMNINAINNRYAAIAFNINGSLKFGLGFDNGDGAGGHGYWDLSAGQMMSIEDGGAARFQVLSSTNVNNLTGATLTRIGIGTANLVKFGGSGSLMNKKVDMLKTLWLGDTIFTAPAVLKPSSSPTDSVWVRDNSDNSTKLRAQADIASSFYPTWQQTLTTGSTLNVDNTSLITGGKFFHLKATGNVNPSQHYARFYVDSSFLSIEHKKSAGAIYQNVEFFNDALTIVSNNGSTSKASVIKMWGDSGYIQSVGTDDMRLRFNTEDGIYITGRFATQKGAAITATGDLTLGKDGNVFHITGATTINAVITANWKAGAEVILIFDSNPTVKNNTAGGAGTAVMLLAGGADFSATANDVLKLVYDGTSWFEVSRSVN